MGCWLNLLSGGLPRPIYLFSYVPSYCLAEVKYPYSNPYSPVRIRVIPGPTVYFRSAGELTIRTWDVRITYLGLNFSSSIIKAWPRISWSTLLELLSFFIISLPYQLKLDYPSHISYVCQYVPIQIAINNADGHVNLWDLMVQATEGSLLLDDRGLVC